MEFKKLQLHTQGYFDDKGNRVKDKKTGEDRPFPILQWLLFEKCMRGDTADNVFSAFPGVRTKGTKTRVGLTEAFEDRNSKGYSWNNMMLQRWVDHEGFEHRVIDDYTRNVTLCDLSAQSDEIKKEIIKETVASVKTKAVEQVGLKLIKFCAQMGLAKNCRVFQSYAEPIKRKI